MSVSLQKHKQQIIEDNVYDFFEDQYGTEILHFKRVGPHTFNFIKRLYVAKKPPVALVIHKHFFHCHCGKLHTYSGIGEHTKCKCGINLWPMVLTNIRIYGLSMRMHRPKLFPPPVDKTFGSVSVNSSPLNEVD